MKKGELAWEYIAAFILALIIVVVMIVFSAQIKEKIVDGINYFSSTILGR
jgi:hypothetical protein